MGEWVNAGMRECGNAGMMIVRTVLGPLLIAEALLTSFWIARHLPGLFARDTITVVIIAIRAMAAALALMSGMWLIERRPIARSAARVALVASATLTTLELGCRLAPSNVDPAWRWPLVAASWMYAGAWLIALSTGKKPVPV